MVESLYIQLRKRSTCLPPLNLNIIIFLDLTEGNTTCELTSIVSFNIFLTLLQKSEVEINAINGILTFLPMVPSASIYPRIKCLINDLSIHSGNFKVNVFVGVQPNSDNLSVICLLEISNL